MSRLVSGVGIFFILVGLLVLVWPESVVSIVDWESRQGQLVAAGMRIVIGLVLLLSATATRYPRSIRIAGGLILLAGLGLPLIPLETWAGLIRWWLVENLIVYRIAGALVGILIGAFLLHAARPGGNKQVLQPTE